jgi:UDP:flavonoid glycosyltransferase YjiC (YdhE family)
VEEAQKRGRLLLVAWAPQLAVLCHPAVKLFVSHGGLNSTHEGLAAGKPLLVTPFFADQPGGCCCARVSPAGYGPFWGF